MNLSSLFWILFCSLQISGNTLGSLVLTWKVTKCILRSKGSCLAEKNLPFFPVDCPSNSCPNRARFAFSIEQLQELSSTTWDMECDVSFCYTEVRIYQPLLMFHINTTLYSFNVFNSVALNSENLPVWQTYGHFWVSCVSASSLAMCIWRKSQQEFGIYPTMPRNPKWVQFKLQHVDELFFFYFIKLIKNKVAKKSPNVPLSLKLIFDRWMFYI